MQARVLSLTLLVLAVFAQQWSPFIRVDDDCKTEVRQVTMFSDHKAQVTHYFWCQYNTKDRKYNLLYRRQYANGIFSPVDTLDTEHECERMAATGPHDGEQIFLAYQADRRIAHTHCSADMKDGCLDIYTLNSADGGFTWGTPMAVSRSNPNDIWNRQNPKIVMNPETNRVWIFYVLANVEQTSFSIGYVTRPEGSIAYSAERTIAGRKELIMDITVALSNIGGDLLVHLVWTGEVGGNLQLRQAISNSNGESWSTSALLDPGFAGKFTSDIKMDQGYMVLPYLKDTKGVAQLSLTSDRSRSWRKKQISTKTGIADVALCYKTSRNDGIVFTLLNADMGDGKFEGEYGYMKIANENWIRGTNPFGGRNLAYDPTIRCYVENGKFVVKAVAIEMGQNQNQIHLTQLVIDP